MSSKADTLFRKATSYERLALYGDRKAYLAALAQSSFPDVKSIISAINGIRTQTATAITNFWRQDPNTFPIAAREALSGLRYPQVDITSATGDQLTTGMDQLITALTDVYRALSVANDQKSTEFAQQTVYPALQRLQAEVQNYKSAAESIPSAGPDAGPTAPGAPSARKPGGGGISVSPAELKAIQNFVNKEMLNKFPPVTPDGKWGPETARLVKEWGDANGFTGQPLQTVVDEAKAEAMGNQVANTINPGSNLEQARRTQ